MFTIVSRTTELRVDKTDLVQLIAEHLQMPVDALTVTCKVVDTAPVEATYNQYEFSHISVVVDNEFINDNNRRINGVDYYKR